MRSIPPPHPGRRHQRRPFRSLDGTRRQPHRAKQGGNPGYPGHRQVLLPPTTVKELRPERCPSGSTTFTLTTPYHTHQVIELPPIAMEVTHWMLHQGWCLACGRWRKAQVPAEQATGYGPRCSALMGALAGSYGNGRRMVQTLCASVLQVPLSLGAIQNVLDRVAQAIDPYYNNRAERALRCGVLWRKRSLGTASEKGNRWVERVAYLSYADNVSRLLPNSLSDVNQPVICSRNSFSKPHRSRLASL